MEKRYMQFIINQYEKNLAGACIHLIRTPYYYKIRNHLKKNRELKNKRVKDKCYIIGLGPSLKELDLGKIKDGDIITGNAFYRNENILDVSPLVYIMLDWRLYCEEEHIKTRTKAMEMFPDTNFILNGKFFNKDIDSSNCFWICTWGTENFPREIDLSKVCPSFENVINLAIYVAIYMGYKEIILLGCDFNSFALRKKVHSYGVEERTIPLSYELFMYAFVADSHHKLSKYAVSNNVKIINATKGSLLDAYMMDESISDSLLKDKENENI